MSKWGKVTNKVSNWSKSHLGSWKSFSKTIGKETLSAIGGIVGAYYGGALGAGAGAGAGKAVTYGSNRNEIVRNTAYGYGAAAAAGALVETAGLASVASHMGVLGTAAGAGSIAGVTLAQQAANMANTNMAAKQAEKEEAVAQQQYQAEVNAANAQALENRRESLQKLKRNYTRSSAVSVAGGSAGANGQGDVQTATIKLG